MSIGWTREERSLNISRWDFWVYGGNCMTSLLYALCLAGCLSWLHPSSAYLSTDDRMIRWSSGFHSKRPQQPPIEARRRGSSGSKCLNPSRSRETQIKHAFDSRGGRLERRGERDANKKWGRRKGKALSFWSFHPSFYSAPESEKSCSSRNKIIVIIFHSVQW